MASTDELSDINLTPLVDVMLVLLIVFIIAAPLIVPQALDINLPQTEATRSDQIVEPELLYVYADGEFGAKDRRMSLDEVRSWFMEELNTETRVVIHADETVEYGTIARLIAMAQTVGMTQLTFRTVVSSKP